jgi:hypothetical protein
MNYLMRRWRRAALPYVIAGVAALALAAGVVLASPGDQISPPGPILPANGCGANNGISVAFDGTNILFTCTNEAAVRRTDTLGTDLGSVATADAGGNPVSLDAIAWDSNESVLWGGNTDNGMCNIWSADLSTGIATFRFSFNAPNCGVTFFDGITVDRVTDTLYVSPDVHTEIFHMNKDGTPGANGTIDFESLTAGQCPWAQGFGASGCFNSGLAIGLDGNLFAGTAQDGKIFQLLPVGPVLVGQFATVTGRDEDLECGPLVNGFETILSRDFETGRIDILEAPDGTCVITEIGLDPSAAVNDFTVDQNHSVTTTVTANGQPLPGVQITFTVVSGPNDTEVSGPGECTTDANCLTDAAGQTSWSYSSVGLGTDTIHACFTTAGGTEHCAEAAKLWADLTAPEAACTPGTNPHGNTVPPAGLKAPGQNEDGYYELTATDVLDPDPLIFVVDSGTGTVFGPFPSGTTIKYTQAPGATPSIKSIGSANGDAGAVAWHIIGQGDMEMYAVDDAGNQSAPVSCLVPPPPK